MTFGISCGVFIRDMMSRRRIASGVFRAEVLHILAFGGQITEAEYEQFWEDLKNSAAVRAPEEREADK